MNNFRPICDTWWLGRPKIKYYGAFPSGFLERARAFLCSETEPLLHVCAGKVRDYPFAGFGPNDRTLDLDPETKPDFLMDARCIGLEERVVDPDEDHSDEVPVPPRCEGLADASEFFWPAVLVDRPYTEQDAQHYAPCVRDKLPDLNDLLRRCLEITRPGGSVGVLDYFLPRPPKLVGASRVRFVACIQVQVGFGNRGRTYSVFRRELPRTDAQKALVRRAIRGDQA